jgi:hypothetical protein
VSVKVLHGGRVPQLGSQVINVTNVTVVPEYIVYHKVHSGITIQEEVLGNCLGYILIILPTQRRRKEDLGI